MITYKCLTSGCRSDSRAPPPSQTQSRMNKTSAGGDEGLRSRVANNRSVRNLEGKSVSVTHGELYLFIVCDASELLHPEHNLQHPDSKITLGNK